MMKEGSQCAGKRQALGAPACCHQYRQPEFQVYIDSTSPTNTQVLLASGVIVMGVDDWVIKLANVA